MKKLETSENKRNKNVNAMRKKVRLLTLNGEETLLRRCHLTQDLKI